jgi:AcrR family transcriptional regulator
MAAAADPAPAPAPPPPASPCPPQAATRRRGETLEQAIYQAVLDQLQGVGYARLTMEGVAACARTGKAALYRRWPRKEDLVVDALDHAMPSMAELPDTGSLRDDLLVLLRRTAAIANSATGCALRCLLAEVDREHPFARLLHERVFEPRKHTFEAVLERAAGRGQLRPGVAAKLVADVGPALVMQRFLAEGPPIPDDYLVSVLDEVVLPLLRP